MIYCHKNGENIFRSRVSLQNCRRINLFKEEKKFSSVKEKKRRKKLFFMFSSSSIFVKLMEVILKRCSIIFVGSLDGDLNLYCSSTLGIWSNHEVCKLNYSETDLEIDWKSVFISGCLFFFVLEVFWEGNFFIHGVGEEDCWKSFRDMMKTRRKFCEKLLGNLMS